MSRTPYPSQAVYLLFSTAVLLSPAAVGSAALENECREEARLYEIAEEQQADYIAGCLASRGGATEPQPIEEEVSDAPADAAQTAGGEVASDPSMEVIEQ